MPQLNSTVSRGNIPPILPMVNMARMAIVDTETDLIRFAGCVPGKGEDMIKAVHTWMKKQENQGAPPYPQEKTTRDIRKP